MVLRQFGLGVVTCRGHCGNRDVCTELLALPNHTAWGTKLVNSGMSGLPKNKWCGLASFVIMPREKKYGDCTAALYIPTGGEG